MAIGIRSSCAEISFDLFFSLVVKFLKTLSLQVQGIYTEFPTTGLSEYGQGVFRWVKT